MIFIPVKEKNNFSMLYYVKITLNIKGKIIEKAICFSQLNLVLQGCNMGFYVKTLAKIINYGVKTLI